MPSPFAELSFVGSPRRAWTSHIRMLLSQLPETMRQPSCEDATGAAPYEGPLYVVTLSLVVASPNRKELSPDPGGMQDPFGENATA